MCRSSVSRYSLNSLFTFLSLLLLNVVALPLRSEAVSLPVDLFLEGDPASIPYFPVATIDITDLGGDMVQFDITPIANLKFDNLGLGLDSSVNESQLVLTPLTADQMSLDTGGWLGFPFKVNFDDKPSHFVSFKLSAPGLDLTDFLNLPASIHYTNTNFALRYWFMVDNDVLDTTAGHDPSVPEPSTMLLFGTGLVVAAYRRRRA